MSPVLIPARALPDGTITWMTKEPPSPPPPAPDVPPRDGFRVQREIARRQSEEDFGPWRAHALRVWQFNLSGWTTHLASQSEPAAPGASRGRAGRRGPGYLSLIAAWTFAATSGGIVAMPCAVLACSAPLDMTSATSLPSMTKLQPGITSPHFRILAMSSLPSGPTGLRGTPRGSRGAMIPPEALKRQRPSADGRGRRARSSRRPVAGGRILCVTSNHRRHRLVCSPIDLDTDGRHEHLGWQGKGLRPLAGRWWPETSSHLPAGSRHLAYGKQPAHWPTE